MVTTGDPPWLLRNLHIAIVIIVETPIGHIVLHIPIFRYYSILLTIINYYYSILLFLLDLIKLYSIFTQDTDTFVIVQNLDPVGYSAETLQVRGKLDFLSLWQARQAPPELWRLPGDWVTKLYEGG